MHSGWTAYARLQPDRPKPKPTQNRPHTANTSLSGEASNEENTLRYPTQHASAVNHVAVTIASTSDKATRGSIAATILVWILGTSRASAESFQVAGVTPSANSCESKLTANRSESTAAPAQPEAVVSAPTSKSGIYLWLGPTGARTISSTGADSSVGIEVAATRICGRAALEVAGLTVGAARYASSDDGRVWASGLAATRAASVLIGVSAGPLLELSPLARPRIGASAGVWVFAGVIPFARVAAVPGRGIFAELGLSIALPVRRWAW